jgi:molybdopterin-guanine dinucleotide biosynthesis protein A
MMDESLPAAPLAAIVLAGGRSMRMGRDKASIRVGGEPLLTRTTRVVAEVARPVVVVAAAEQVLEMGPLRVEVVRDEEPHGGPLVALVRGLDALGERASHVFVCGTDHPRLAASVIARLNDLAQGHDAAVATIGGRPQLLCAVFRTAIRDRAHALVGRGQRSMRALAEQLDVRAVTAEELLDDPLVTRDDPALDSFVDVDTPEDLRKLERPE